MARFAGLGLEPILADSSDDDDGDMAFRGKSWGDRGGDDKRGKGNDAVRSVLGVYRRVRFFYLDGGIFIGLSVPRSLPSEEPAWDYTLLLRLCSCGGSAACSLHGAEVTRASSLVVCLFSKQWQKRKIKFLAGRGAGTVCSLGDRAIARRRSNRRGAAFAVCLGKYKTDICWRRGRCCGRMYPRKVLRFTPGPSHCVGATYIITI